MMRSPIFTTVHIKKDPGCTPIDRSSALGNPFALDREGDRPAVVEAYRRYAALVTLDGMEPTEAALKIITGSQASLRISVQWQRPTRSRFMAEIQSLMDRAYGGEAIALGCWCSPKACHGDPLADCLRYLMAYHPSPDQWRQFGRATAIIGSRDFKDRAALERAVRHCGWPVTAVLCGEAKGPDSWGKQWAITHRRPVLPFPADWLNLDAPGAVVKIRPDGTAYNARAGMDRNAAMVAEAEAVIALWDGRSTGTADAIKEAKRRNIPIHIEAPTAIASQLNLSPLIGTSGS